MIRILLIVPLSVLLSVVFLNNAHADTAAERAARAFKREVRDKKEAAEEKQGKLEKIDDASAFDSEKSEEKDASEEAEPREDPKWQKTLDKAAKEAQEGRIGRAYSLYERVSEQEDAPQAAEKAQAELESIVATGKQLVKAALELDDAKEARKKLSTIYKDYWQTPVKDSISEAREQLTVRTARTRAETGAEPDQETVNPGEDARMWLIIGDIHKLNGRTDEARRAYSKLIYEYPDSRYVDQARERLSQLDVEAAQSSGDL